MGALAQNRLRTSYPIYHVAELGLDHHVVVPGY